MFAFFPRKIFITFLISLLALGFSSNILAFSVVTQWNDAALSAIRSTKSTPTKTARALAIVNTCMFDAWAVYDDNAKGTRFGASLRQSNPTRKDVNKTQAISYAARACLSNLFPGAEQVAVFNDLLSSLGYDVALVNADYPLPAILGQKVADAVLAYRHDDGANQFGDEVSSCGQNSTVPYSDYTCYQSINSDTVLSDPNHWQPLGNVLNGQKTVQKFLTPQWGLVTPYSLVSGSQFRSSLSDPIDFYLDPVSYQLQAQEIIDITANLNDEKKSIAEYWADGPNSETPPGHWVLFAEYISDRDRHDLNDDVKMFFALTNAMFDASIAVWDAKTYFDYVRPISAIRFLYAGQTLDSWNGQVTGETWQPYQQANALTPPFSEYVSGHSSFSASAAETLKSFTGSDFFNAQVIIAAGSSKVQPTVAPAKPIKLAWKTFTDAANEAGISRRYGGIHFKQGDLESRVLGRKVAKQAWKKSLSYFNSSHNKN
ncbi:MAG: vanadium-dependent haloperoxidase [Methylococcales bacterium]|nr:vanadium-dependent haloperoxidase [Methylococcales bacterium]